MPRTLRQMNENRIALLERYRKESPEDPFYLYGIALEYLETDKPRSIALLEECTDLFPAYLPAYYQLGAALLQHNRLEQAKKIIELGIKVAQNQQNSKTLQELRTLLEEGEL